MADMIKVLIIEDNPAVQALTCDLLTAENFQVETASTGSEGREQIEKYKPDLLILDLSLPDDFGLDIRSDVKKNHPTILVFILTALGNSQDVVAGFEAGADDYLAKPFNKREFIARVQLVLRRANKIK
jgi:DNA-binding response OmpR family regulator